MKNVTQILSDIENGDPQAAGDLLPLVYEELRRLAAQHLAQEKPGQTLQATALVHEAFLRLVGPEGESPLWRSRGHFFAAAAKAMRRILVDNARRKNALKHGGGRRREALVADMIAISETDTDLVALEHALNRLAQIDPVKAQLVELRYFAGLSGEQAANVLGIAPATVDRHWAYVRAWLRHELESGEADRANSEKS